MRVFEAFAEELHRREVEALFSVPASGTMKIIVHAVRHGISHYSARHEQVAVGMADGYSRISGKVGVVLVGRGPGLTNGANALMTASKAGSRVLVISGEITTALAEDPDAAARDIASMQNVDQERFLQALDVVPVTVGSPDTAVADLAAAYELAESGAVVGVLLRSDVAEEEAGSAPSRISLPHPAGKEPVPPKTADITQVADLLAETWAVRRPLILAGRGAVASGAVHELLRVGEAIGAIMGTSLLAKRSFDSCDFSVGVVGTESTPVASELIVRSDLVLVFGASLNLFTTYGRDLFRDAQVLQVDSDERALGVNYPVDMAILADARLAAAALADELDRRSHREVGYRTDEVRRRIEEERVEDWVQDGGQLGALDPRVVLIEIEKKLPAERALVVDCGAHMSFTSRYISASEPAAFLLTHDYGSVGAGMGIALGAAVARPDRPTVLGIGDGGLMMTLADLNTAVRYRLPLVVVVMNDGGFGQEVHLLENDDLPGDVALYDNPPFTEVASALGAAACRIESLSDVDGLDQVISHLAGPLLIDCPVTLDVRGEHTDLLVRMARGVSTSA